MKQCLVQGDKWWTLEAGARLGRLDEGKEEEVKESKEERHTAARYTSIKSLLKVANVV